MINPIEALIIDIYSMLVTYLNDRKHKCNGYTEYSKHASIKVELVYDNNKYGLNYDTMLLIVDIHHDTLKMYNVVDETLKFTISAKDNNTILIRNYNHNHRTDPIATFDIATPSDRCVSKIISIIESVDLVVQVKRALDDNVAANACGVYNNYTDYDLDRSDSYGYKFDPDKFVYSTKMLNSYSSSVANFDVANDELLGVDYDFQFGD